MTYTWAMTTYSAVVTTGIYCRPGCAARPLARNVRTFDLAAAAEAAGFRACERCRPYRVAGPVGSSPSPLSGRCWSWRAAEPGADSAHSGAPGAWMSRDGFAADSATAHTSPAAV